MIPSTSPPSVEAPVLPGDLVWSRGSASTAWVFSHFIEKRDSVPSSSATGPESEPPPTATKPPAARRSRSACLGTQTRDDVHQDVEEVKILTFLTKVYHLNRQGKYHLAIDEILTFFDEALLENNIAQCQQTLRQLDASQLSASVIKTVLVITGKAKPWLPERESFYRRAKDHLGKTRGAKDAARLLDKHC